MLLHFLLLMASSIVLSIIDIDTLSQVSSPLYLFSPIDGGAGARGEDGGGQPPAAGAGQHALLRPGEGARRGRAGQSAGARRAGVPDRRAASAAAGPVASGRPTEPPEPDDPAGQQALRQDAHRDHRVGQQTGQGWWVSTDRVVGGLGGRYVCTARVQGSVGRPAPVHRVLE